VLSSTGSNIPTSEETGQIGDTYRVEDIQNWVSLTQQTWLVRLPQEAGSPPPEHCHGGDGSVVTQPAWLVALKNVGLGGWKNAWPHPNGTGVDINLIPFPFIDHIDILKDGAFGYLWSRCGGGCH